MARLPNFLVIIRSEKLSGKGQGRGAKKRTFRFGKKNVSFPKVETFRFADYTTANEAIEAPEQDVKVVVMDGKIFVSTPENMRVEVYGILGKCCYNAIVNGDAMVSGLPAGVYVVRAGKQIVKVSIR